MANFKYMLMQTALEKLLEYVSNSYNDEVLDGLIEEINGICGTIERINRRINVIEQERTTFGNISNDLEIELGRLNRKLTLEISRL